MTNDLELNITGNPFVDSYFCIKKKVKKRYFKYYNR